MSQVTPRKHRPTLPSARSATRAGAGSPPGQARGTQGQPAAIQAIDQGLRLQLRRAAEVLEQDDSAPPYRWIRDRAARHLSQIGRLANRGAVCLDEAVRTSTDQPPASSRPRTLRLGVFPVAADPLHWGHLLFSLQAIAALGLDRVVFIVQGQDPRKRAGFDGAEEHRHAIARQTLALLDPLVAYSDLGRGSSTPGEDNLFRLLQLNAGRHIDAWYMAGADHHRLTDVAGNPDTLPRIEANLEQRRFGYDWTRHRLRVLFARRRGLAPLLENAPVPTCLSVRFLPEVLLASSTAVRRGALDLVPYTVLEYLREHPEYTRSIGLPRPGPAAASERSA